MNTAVNIGSSQDYELRKALLVYGESNHNSFPYRYPFVTIHDVELTNGTPSLGPGRLLTSDLLLKVVQGLGVQVPAEILPERVLVRTETTMVWWSPAQCRTMFFDVKHSDAMVQRLTGQPYPHPPLVFKASSSGLFSIRALADNARPSPDTQLYLAPYWNCAMSGQVCLGSMPRPVLKTVEAIDMWEQGFFQSAFSHAGGATKVTRYKPGFLAMWDRLRGKKRFPVNYLIPVTQTLQQFVNGQYADSDE